MSFSPLIPAAQFITRRIQAAQIAKDQQLDALLVTDLDTIAYLTGFTGSAGTLVIDGRSDRGEGVLCSDGRYDIQIRQQTSEIDILISRSGLAETLSQWSDSFNRGRASTPHTHHIGYVAHHVSVAQFNAMAQQRRDAGCEDQYTDIGTDLDVLRDIKSAEEIEAIAASCELATSAWLELLETSALRAGRTEQEVAADLEYSMKKRGAQAIAFDTIVATGPHSAIPHHRPTDRVIAAGDFVKVDFGAMLDGYASDCTRTITIGPASQWQREIHSTVLQAYRAGMDAAVAGTPAHEVDAAARDIIEQAGYGEYFGHSLGHGVGVNVHEGPVLASRSRATLAAGNIVTIEPGIYLPDKGGVRIEDTVAVHSGPVRRLTTSNPELIELPI